MVNGVMEKLSEDVFIYTLLRLPVKSLMRFKCVSKVGYTLIQSSAFIKFHLNRTTTTEEELILLKRSIEEESTRYKTILSFLSNDDDNLNPLFPDLDVPCLVSTCSSNFDQLFGPCQGLIALIDYVNTFLLNPATRNYRIIPPSPLSSQERVHLYVQGAGFGFDSIAKEYKIVMIEVIYRDTPCKDPELGEKKVEVYDFSIDSWRELDHVSNDLPTMFWVPCSEMFYKGACHWFALSEPDTVDILCFDLSSEVFRIMKMPDSCRFFNGPSYGLLIKNESLTLICYPDEESEVYPRQESIDIWIMKEYGAYDSWIKKQTIRPLPIEIPLSIWKDDLLLFQSKNGFLLSYDLNSGEVKQYNLHGCPKSLRAVVYKECLTQIQRGGEHSTEVQKF
uniref:S9-locus linked F-box protein 1 n=1 Tax=Petunia hybrida TaxID=4102 RepID=A0A140JNK2_PETHY|nr:S9-locus linked F-box protein 1 [Petunia x hybrida]